MAISGLLDKLIYKGPTPGVFWRSFMHGVPDIPDTLFLALVGWFTLDGWLWRREKREERPWPTTNRLWLATIVCVAGFILAFCATQSVCYTLWTYEWWSNPFPLLLLFGLAALLSTVATFRSRLKTESVGFAESVALPLSVLLVVYVYEYTLFRHFHSDTPGCWPRPAGLAITLGVVVIIGFVAARIERRILSTRRRSVVLITILLWTLAAMFTMVYIGMTYCGPIKIRPHQLEDEIVVGFILGTLAVSTVARVWLHSRRRRAARVSAPA